MGIQESIAVMFLSVVIGYVMGICSALLGYNAGRMTYIAPEKPKPKESKNNISTHDSGSDPFSDAMSNRVATLRS